MKTRESLFVDSTMIGAVWIVILQDFSELRVISVESQ